jgi:predicted regulator of Ras-like GTPase activity (Roadblock/LC7/MglB family)
MDAAKALAELTAVSSQIEAAVLAGEKGEVLASTLDDPAASERVAAAAAELLRAGVGGTAPLSHVVATTSEGVVLAAAANGRTIAAVTAPDPTIGLVLYDLKTTLRSVEEAKPKRTRTARPKAQTKQKDADA